MVKKYRTYRQPQNETKEHYLLKEISKYILHVWGYNRIATEVTLPRSFDLKYNKHIVDVIGAKRKKKSLHGRDFTYLYDIRAIEAKASLADFKNGYCATAASTYIIAPKDIIPIKLLPDKIGLIEVDLDDFSIKNFAKSVLDHKDITITKKAKYKIDSVFGTKDEYEKWCSMIIDEIAYRNTRELLFWRNFIKLR